MKKILQTILISLALAVIPLSLVIVSNVYKVVETINDTGVLGVQLPTVVALFTDSLATRISSSATSFTLVRGTDKQSRSLNGLYGFVIDEGTASEEFFTARCVATACTVTARGLDVQDGKTEITALKQDHRRGAIVKQTDFPILAYLARILNGQESASSTFRFGDGSTTTTLFKTIMADNGVTNLPFVRYNEATQKWQFSDDGTNSTDFVATVGGLSASTTAGVFITDSKIGVYASSTGSLSFDTLGRLFVNPTFNIPAIFRSTVDVTGTLTVNSPTSTRDAVNKGYSDSSVQGFYATGTLGISATYGQALYISTTGTLFLADADSSDTSFRYVGVAMEAGSVGSSIKYARPGAIVNGLSGLTQGSDHYLSGTAGALSVSPGAISVKLLFAVTTSSGVLYRPSMVQRAVGNIDAYNFTGTPSSVVNLGWIPTKVYFTCGSLGNVVGSTGQWQVGSNGSSAQSSFGSQDNAAVATVPVYYDRVCSWLEGGAVFDLKMTTSTGGFFVSSTRNIATTRVIRYQAEYVPE